VIAFARSNFSKRETKRVVVQTKFVEDGNGDQRFGEDVPSDVPGRRYLRLILPDQVVIEVRCDPETYHVSEEGCVGFADLQGRMMFSFRRLPDASIRAQAQVR
jgi:hypothetical protein